MNIFGAMNISESTFSSMPHAFFDVDDTLISIKSMLSFQDYWYEINNNHDDREQYYVDLQRYMHVNSSWEDLNRRYYQYFSGRKVSEVDALCEQWFYSVLQCEKEFFHPLPLAELKKHQSLGHEIVFVSGSFPALLRPIANHLGVKYVLATTMEIVKDCYTGRILEPQTIGEGKAIAIRDFLQNRGISHSICYAYGDDVSDIPMLVSVGKPTVVRGGRKLEGYAKQFGWRVISPT